MKNKGYVSPRQHGDPRTDLNRRRRLEDVRQSHRIFGIPETVTQQQVDADPVLRKLLAERRVRVGGEVKKPRYPRPRQPESEREARALKELDAAASEVYGTAEWVFCSNSAGLHGYPRRVPWRFVHRHPTRGRGQRGEFKTLDALLDDYEAKSIEYLEWAAGRGL